MSRTLVVENASEIGRPQPAGRGIDRLERHALFIEHGHIAWLGPSSELPEHAKDAERYDAKGGAVLPALIDCHTHLIHAGDRVDDFAERARGTSYAQIAARGGGILTTVTATRAATTTELADTLIARLEARRRYGIGTTEVKSGYALSAQGELSMLEAAQIARARGFDIESTLLAAHTVPKDTPREVYLDQIVDQMIPTTAKRGLARFVDVFVEQGAYTIDEARRVFQAAKAHGLHARIHADQITAGGGAELAAEVGATSADHLERASPGGLQAMKDAGVVAVLLPGAMVFLGDAAPGLGKQLRDVGVEIAVATDANPGSSPMSNLPLAGTLAVTLMGLHAEEAIRAMTLGAAHVLARQDVGSFELGAKGRFIVLDHPDCRALVYAFGEPVVRELVLCD